MDLTYKYYHKKNAKTAYLVLHGGGAQGIETDFISNVIESLTTTGASVLGFNFPYCERGEENSSGTELVEEIDSLQQAVDFLHQEGYENIIIVAKSLGAIVASYWLSKNPNKTIKLIVLGYVIGEVKTKAIAGNLITVIQGQNDRFGNAQAVKDELGNITANIIEIKDADHSYRDSQKNPIYQKQTIEALLDSLKK